MKNSDKITSNQLIAITISLIIGIGILSLPRAVTEEAGPDGWLLVLAGGIIAIITSVVMARLGMMFPGQTVVEYSKAIITKPLGILFSLGFLVYFVLFCAFEARVFSEIIKQFLLDRTPTEVLVFSIILCSAYLVRQDIGTLGRMAEMVVPVIIIPFFLLSVPAVSDMDFTNFLPFIRTSPLRLLAGMGTIVTSYLGFEIVLLFQPYMNRPRDAGKAMVTAMTAIMAFYLAVVVATVAFFGVVEVQHLIWPGLSLFRVVEVPGAFLENIHGVFMAIWVASVFMTLSAFFFAGVLTLSRMVKVREHSFLVLPLVPVIYILALVPDNIPQVYEYLDMFSLYLGLPFAFFLPIALYIAAKIRKMDRGKEDKDGNVVKEGS